MELIKKHIYMNRQKCRSSLQMTLDDDFNVPDSKPDIARLLKTDGEIRISEKKPMNGKLLITGSLLYRILYISEDLTRPLHTLQGELPFSESVNIEEACAADELSISWEFEDLSAGIINSRKFSLRSLVLFTILGDELYSHEAAVDTDGNPDIRYRKKPLSLTGVAVNRKDSYRIREALTLPNAKPSVQEVLYYELRPYHFDLRLMADKFTLSCDLSVFLCYLADQGSTVPEYYETELPISTTIDCPSCQDSLIPYVTITPGSHSLEIKPDEDGEERRLEAELLIDLGIKLYEEQELNVIDDCYSIQNSIQAEYTPVTYETLLQKNNSRTRITDRIAISPSLPKLLQICHTGGTVKLDSVQPIENGLLAEGVLESYVFYISSDDTQPLEVLSSTIPFSHTIEIHNMSEDCIYEVRAQSEQVSAMLLDQENLEIKAGLVFDSIAFRKLQEPFLTDIRFVDTEEDSLTSLPSMSAYAVRPEDSLWDIAKRFLTTEDAIREINELSDSPPSAGELLLIVRDFAS